MLAGESRGREAPTPAGGRALSPRKRCTALTASASVTTSEEISNSRAHARARAATVLAPKHLATLQEGTGGAVSAGVPGRAGDSRPQGPLPPCRGWGQRLAQRRGLKLSHEWRVEAHDPLWRHNRDCAAPCTDPENQTH